MNEFLKLVGKILVFFYYWIESIILFFVPKRFKFKDINGEIALITGAGSGIGRLMAIKFAERGATLVVWDMNGDANEETAKLIRENGGKAHAYTVDVTDRNAVYKTASRVKQEVGDVTILVNNAGIVAGKNILDLDDKQIEKVFTVNVLSHFWIIKPFLPHMKAKNRGHLVTIASLAGLGGMPKLTDYCASKFAAVGLMESLYIELRASGYNNIHTTTVCPFFINTGMFNGAGSKMFSMLEPEYVAEQVVQGVLSNQALILMPKIFYSLNVLKSLIPIRALLTLHEACGGYDSMKTFTGRNSKKVE